MIAITNYPEGIKKEAKNLLSWIEIRLGKNSDYDSKLVKMVLSEVLTENQYPDNYIKDILKVLSENKNKSICKAAKELLKDKY